MAGNDVVMQFEIPGPEPSGILGSGHGPTIMAGPRSSIRVTVRASGEPEFEQITPGKDPERVVPTAQELAYVKEIIAARKEANPSATETRLANAQATIAENTAAKAETPDEKALRQRREAAQTTVAEAQAAQAGPETIRRPAPADVRREVPGATETVTKVQADYDRQVQGDQRQALIDLQNRTAAAETKAHQDALLRIDQEKWTHQQALDQYNKDLDAIKLQTQAEQNRITQRGQDISIRGQDISAGVQSRGQDIGFQSSGGESAAATFRAMLPYMNAPGQIESTNSLMAGRGPVPTQPTPVPSPVAPWMQGVAAAQGMMPSPYTLPGAPPQVPAGQYQLPG